MYEGVLFTAFFLVSSSPQTLKIAVFWGRLPWNQPVTDISEPGNTREYPGDNVYKGNTSNKHAGSINYMPEYESNVYIVQHGR